MHLAGKRPSHTGLLSITWGRPMAQQSATVIPMLSLIQRLTAWMQPRTWIFSSRAARWYTEQRETMRGTSQTEQPLKHKWRRESFKTQKVPRAVPDISASAARLQSLQTTEGTAESLINQSETERIVLTPVSAGGSLFSLRQNRSRIWLQFSYLTTLADSNVRWF